jgi:hypothetical protein
MILAIWILAAFGLLLWSLLAWGVHAVLTIDPQWVGGLGPLVDKIPYGDVLSQWIPGWQDLLRMGLDITQSLLGWMGGAAPVIVIVLWAIGALLVLGGAVVLTVIVKIVRRSATAVAARA